MCGPKQENVKTAMSLAFVFISIFSMRVSEEERSVRNGV